MIKEKLSSHDIVFVPKCEKGDFLFDGIPCPSKKAWNILGKKGIAIIHNKMANILANTKERFGDDQIKDYGFGKTVNFLDIRTHTIFKVGGVIHDFLDKPNPIELVIHENLKAHNYANLKNLNHYIIRISNTEKTKLLKTPEKYNSLIRAVDINKRNKL